MIWNPDANESFLKIILRGARHGLDEEACNSLLLSGKCVSCLLCLDQFLILSSDNAFVDKSEEIAFEFKLLFATSTKIKWFFFFVFGQHDRYHASFKVKFSYNLVPELFSICIFSCSNSWPIYQESLRKDKILSKFLSCWVSWTVCFVLLKIF